MVHFKKLTGLIFSVLMLSSVAVKAQDVNLIILNVRNEYAPDKRVAVFEVEGEKVNASHYILKGKSDNPEAVKALEAQLKNAGIPYTNYIMLLPDAALGDKHWALVTLCNVNIRAKGSHAAELGTQGLMGTPVKVLESRDGWYRVQTPEGYISWVDGSAIAQKTEEEMNAWRNAKRCVYKNYLGFIYEQPDEKNTATVSDIVLGCILEVTNENAGKKFMEVVLPDGRKGYVKKAETEEFNAWANTPLSLEKVEQTARSMMGIPYLWGGTSVKGADCSGFVKTAYFANGVIISRDASQQALIGDNIKATEWPSCELGDLVFFGSNPERVTHVGMYLRGGQYIHCSGRVKINSLDPNAPDYLTTPLLSATRIKTALNTPGITLVKDHRWYVNK